MIKKNSARFRQDRLLEFAIHRLDRRGTKNSICNIDSSERFFQTKNARSGKNFFDDLAGNFVGCQVRPNDKMPISQTI